MSFAYRLYTSLAPKEAIELADACNRAVEEHRAEHPDCEDDCGEVDAELSVRGIGAYLAQARVAGRRVDPELAARAERCRSAIRIDRPGDAQSPLQVAVLRFLVERMSDALFEAEGGPVTLGESLVAELRRSPGIRGFGRTATRREKRPARRRAERPGEARAARTREILVRAMSDAELGLDVRAVLVRVGDLERRYAALLMEDGATTDAAAAKRLGVPADELGRAADTLSRALGELL